MRNQRRRLLALSASAATLLALAAPASTQAQSPALPYPTKPLRIVVGFAAGGGQDQIARMLGQGLTDRLGQQVLIEHRPGPGTIVATEAVVHAQPDGYTLLLVSTSTGINPSLYPKLRYDFVRDIAPVWGLIRETSVLVASPTFEPKTVPDMIAHAKANPGKITMASSGIGAQAHMAGELFKLRAGIDMLHVPYRGTAPALIDVLAGRADVMFSSLPGAIAYIRQGRLRALAVTTAKRSTALPEVPAAAEAVTDYEASGFTGIGAPKGTPAAIIETLNKHLTAVAAEPAAQARFKDLGSADFAMSSAEFARFISDEIDKWTPVIRGANIKPE